MNVILILVLYFTAMKSLGSGESIISDINVTYVMGLRKPVSSTQSTPIHIMVPIS